MRTTGILVGAACLFALAASCMGCATKAVSLAEQGEVHIEESAAGKVYIAWSDAHEEDGTFVITGVVRRHDTVGTPIDVTVHATVASADGAVLEEGTSDIIPVPRRSLTRIQGFERFKIRFPSVPPVGSSIRLVAQSG